MKIQYNYEAAKRIYKNAKRSMDIAKMIINGKEDSQIIEALGCDRSLVQYYRKQLTIKGKE